MAEDNRIHVKQIEQRCPVCLGTNRVEKPNEQGNCQLCDGARFIVAQIERSWREPRPQPANVRSIGEARAKRQPPVQPGGDK